MNSKAWLLSVVFVALSACGGGGGGDSGGGGGVTVPAPSVVITRDNAPSVASTAGSADTITTNSTAGITFFGVGQPSQNAFDLSKFTREMLHLGHVHTLQAQATNACPGGGSVTYPDDPTATSGTVSFNNCSNMGITVNGSASFTIIGNPAANFSATVTYSNFTVTYGTDVSTLNATLSVTGTYAAPNSTITTTISNLHVTHNADYVNVYSYTETITYNEMTLDYTIAWDYTFESNLIGGTVHVATEQVIAGNDSNLYPNTGVLVFTGVSNSHIRVSFSGTGQPTDLVTIEVDANGDGAYENSTSMTWIQFEALAGV